MKIYILTFRTNEGEEIYLFDSFEAAQASLLKWWQTAPGDIRLTQPGEELIEARQYVKAQVARMGKREVQVPSYSLRRAYIRPSQVHQGPINL